MFTNLKTTPKNFTVTSDLDASFSGIENFSEGLTVGGDLDASCTGSSFFPADAKIGRNIKLYKSDISAFHLAEVHGDLDLRHSTLSDLCPGLVVKKDLDASHTKNLTSLPMDIKIGEDITLISSNVTSLSRV